MQGKLMVGHFLPDQNNVSPTIGLSIESEIGQAHGVRLTLDEGFSLATKLKRLVRSLQKDARSL